MSGLTNDGWRLARSAGIALKEIRFDAVYSSPLSRAIITAREVLRFSDNEHVQIKNDERLLEIDMDSYEGKHFRPDKREVDSEVCRLFFEDPFLFPGFPNGENAADVCLRTQSFLEDLVTCDYETVLVSTHGFTLRATLNRLYTDSRDFWQGHVPYNCSISIVQSVEDCLKLVQSDWVLYDEAYCVDRYAE